MVPGVSLKMIQDDRVWQSYMQCGMMLWHLLTSFFALLFCLKAYSSSFLYGHFAKCTNQDSNCVYAGTILWHKRWYDDTKMRISRLYHWCTSVLNKRFKTPFRDGIWNRRQVSVGDRGVLPTRPRNRRGYALLAHTLGKMRSCATGERSNTVIRIVVLKNTIIQAKPFSVVSTSHTVSPR